MASEQLATNGTEHNEHKGKEQCNIDHDWNRFHDGRDELTHVRNLIECSEWTQEPQNLNGRNVTSINELGEPTKHDDNEIELYTK